jgi:dolichol-phosphate mannosyltransferase
MAVEMLGPMWPAAASAAPGPVPRVLVVIPTYNEADNITEVLERTRRMLPDAAILVVDDDSPDGTADRVAMLGRRLGDVSVLRRAGKLGLGSAYRDGFRYGLAEGYDVLVEMDADLSHDPAMLPDLVHAVTDGADLAIGSRYVPGGSVPGWPWWRQAISRVGGTYARLMLRVPVADSTSGFRAFRAATLEVIDLDHVRADGYGFQVEMAYRVHTVGGTITEIPIAFRDRTRGRSKMSMRIVIEAVLLVTRWGVRDRIHGSGSRHGVAATRTRPTVGAAVR